MWDNDLEYFFAHGGAKTDFSTAWWCDVAAPMWASFTAYKDGDLALAKKRASHVTATDWRLAALEWLQRRVEARGVLL